MTIESKAALVSIVETLIGSSSTAISSDGLSSAVDMALMELPWTFPLTNPQKEFWITERARRHVLYVLMVESAHKFKYKEISLQHRFNNYFKLIDMMDTKFEKALEDFPDIFDVLPTYPSLCDYITSGFVYDQYGRDVY